MALNYSTVRLVVVTGSRHFLTSTGGAKAQRKLRDVLAREALAGLFHLVVGDAPGIDTWAKHFAQEAGTHVYPFLLNGQIRFHMDDQYVVVGEWCHGMRSIDERPPCPSSGTRRWPTGWGLVPHRSPR